MTGSGRRRLCRRPDLRVPCRGASPRLAAAGVGAWRAPCDVPGRHDNGPTGAGAGVGQRRRSARDPIEEQPGMSHPVVLSIDVGSSSVRAGLFDALGQSVNGTGSRKPHRFVFSAGGCVEADTDGLAGLVETCIDETLQRLARTAENTEITAVSFSTFLHGMIGTDRAGKALTPVFTWADTRSAEQATRLGKMLDSEQVFQRTGCPLHPAYFPSKILWIKENQPQLFQEVTWWCSIGEYCIRRFTGQKSCSLSMASAFGLFNRSTSVWDQELLGTLGLDDACFSPLADMDSAARGLLPAFAERWPRLCDAAWFPALGDGACSSVGCGCAVPQRAALMIGTTGALRAVRPVGGLSRPGGAVVLSNEPLTGAGRRRPWGRRQPL